MQAIYILYIVLSSTFGISASDGRTEGEIVIDNGKLTIWGTEIDAEWKYSSFMTALGDPERKPDDTPQIEVYDSKGLMIWTESERKEITEFKVVFLPDSSYTIYDWHTKGLYKGKVIIQGATVDANTSLADLTKAVPQYKWEKNGIESYDAAYNGIYIYAQFDAADQKLLWLAIGLDDDNSYD